MGSLVLVTVANLVKQDIELRESTDVSLRFWKQYMDDTYAALPTSRMQELLDHLNGVERSIQFTAEVESEASSHFWTFCSSKIQTGSS